MIVIGKFIDLAGNKYGRLTAIRRIGTKRGSPLWECICECNNYVNVTSRELTSGNTKSCGCLSLERLIEYNHTKKKYNTYDLSGDYGIGYTSKDEEFYFDLEDYDKIKDYCWRINNRGYVTCSVRKNNAIPVTMRSVPKEQAVNQIMQDIEIMRENGIKRIAIITKNNTETLELYDKLKDQLDY